MNILYFDTETDNNNPNIALPFVFGYAFNDELIKTIALRPGENIKELQDIFQRADMLAGYNLKFDLQVLLNYGLDPSFYQNTALFDAVIAAWLYNENAVRKKQLNLQWQAYHHCKTYTNRFKEVLIDTVKALKEEPVSQINKPQKKEYKDRKEDYIKDMEIYKQEAQKNKMFKRILKGQFKNPYNIPKELQNLFTDKHKEIIKSSKDAILDHCMLDVEATRAICKHYVSVANQFSASFVSMNGIIKKLIPMERRGLYIDRDQLLRKERRYKKIIEKKKKEINSLIKDIYKEHLGGEGEFVLNLFKDSTKEFRRENLGAGVTLSSDGDIQFNINSSKQLQYLLFTLLKLEAKKSTETGLSTDEEVLKELANHHKIPKKLISYRKIVKEYSTYIIANIEQVDSKGYLHTCFNQTVTVTSRLSSTRPNAQNQPSKKSYRKIFVAPPGYDMVVGDYSQMELRVLAHLSGDKQLQAHLATGDMHLETAKKIFNDETLTKYNKKERTFAKTINFGIMYGLSKYALAKQLGISEEEANRMICNWYLLYPDVLNYQNNLILQCRKHNYVTTLFGKKRRLYNIDNSTHEKNEALNFPVQGTSSEIVQMAMLALDNMVIQVHDELMFYVPKGQGEEYCKYAKNVMENVVKLDVPLPVDINVVRHWGEK